MSTLGRGIRRSGILQRLQSPEQMQRQQVLARVVNGIGIDPKVLAPYLPLVGEGWGPGETGRKRVRQPSLLVLVAAEASTPPGEGDALIRFTQKTDAGVETLVTLRIPADQSIATFAPMVAVPAGAWLGYAVTTAAGAGGISVSYSLKVG